MTKDTKTFWNKAQGKVIQLDYDVVTALTDECTYCLTDGQVEMILGVLDYFGWSTRWYSEDGLIDQSVISELQADLGARLMNGCCGEDSSVLKRLTPEGKWQTSVDNGETWVDAPLEDPRRRVVYRPQYPVPGEESPKCEWADSVVNVVKEQFIFQLASGATVRDIIAALGGVLTLVFGLAAVAEILIGLAAIPAIVFAFGVIAMQEAFTSDVWDRFRCNIYCHMDANGLGTQGQIDGIYSQIATDETGITRIILQGIVALFGLQGMINASNAGFGSSTADCTECDCFDACADNWEIRGDLVDYCDIIERGEDFVTCQAHTPLSNGTYYVDLRSPSLSDCCYFDHYETLAGTTSAIAGTDCGVDAAPSIGLWTGHCMWIIQPQSSVPFTIKMFLTPCP